MPVRWNSTLELLKSCSASREALCARVGLAPADDRQQEAEDLEDLYYKNHGLANAGMDDDVRFIISLCMYKDSKRMAAVGMHVKDKHAGSGGGVSRHVSVWVKSVDACLTHAVACLFVWRLSGARRGRAGVARD